MNTNSLSRKCSEMASFLEADRKFFTAGMFTLDYVIKNYTLSISLLSEISQLVRKSNTPVEESFKKHYLELLDEVELTKHVITMELQGSFHKLHQELNQDPYTIERK